MIVKLATLQDQDYVMSIDRHVTQEGYRNRVCAQAGYVLWEGAQRVGLLSFCMLWDLMPFLNFIYVDPDFRGRGFARQAILHWEADMKGRGYRIALLSTQVDEGAQHLYRKLGYVDCGCLLFDHTPFDQPMEMFFRKVL